MLFILVQIVRRRPRSGVMAVLRHLGAVGLFFLAILDSTPFPTLGGPDILIAILAGSRRNPWYEYAVVATAGSVVGAYLMYALARGAGTAFVQRKFHGGSVPALMSLFERWGTGALAVSTAVPLPLPTSVFFAAAGASRYSSKRFLAVVTLCRAARYSLIGILAAHYGRHFVRVIRHPGQHWGWLLLFAGMVAALVVGAFLINRQLERRGVPQESYAERS